MKNYTLTGLALFVFALTATAQTSSTEPERPKLRMALSVAPVLSWFNTSGGGDAISGDGLRFNIAYGLHADFALGTSQNYYFSTGVFQVNTGGTLNHEYFVETSSGTYELTDRTTDFRINYVDIPLTLMLRTNEVGYMYYYGRVGFDFGFNFKSTYDSEDVLQNQPQAETRNIDDGDASEWVNLMRAGLHLELGLEFNLTGNTNVLVGVEWNNGLNNVFDKDYKLPTGEMNGDRLTLNPETGIPYVEERIESSIDYLALRVGVYF